MHFLMGSKIMHNHGKRKVWVSWPKISYVKALRHIVLKVFANYDDWGKLEILYLNPKENGACF